MVQTGAMTQTLTEVDQVDLDADFPALYCHLVRPGDVLMTMSTGLPVTALCGFTWVPTRMILKNELPLCPTCSWIDKQGR